MAAMVAAHRRRSNTLWRGKVRRRYNPKEGDCALNKCRQSTKRPCVVRLGRTNAGTELANSVRIALKTRHAHNIDRGDELGPS